ncbi:secreted phosphoprotein 24 isoform X1 [Seriola dumerili]|uniref:secreted phosphoprotein 24 isoform X1 n=2 Tax=Seriola dumerili TaxID=41447 RepID=UPI000BBE6DE9|nr:secreted phosphoprotein 24 isoform X1 [Seriola dumerili]
MNRRDTLVLVRMKSYICLLALLQLLGCSGAPLQNSELESMATRGLEAALAEVNSVYAINHLYRVTRGSVTRVIPVGLNTVDLMMTFGIKETECGKASGSDPQTCAFRPGFFVNTLSCSSRVRISATSTQVVSARCGRDGSSSSESSEEMFSRGRQHFIIPLTNRVPAPSAPSPPPPAQSGRSLHSTQTADVKPRGDAFSNFLV